MAYALTGVEVDLGTQASPDVAVLAAELAARGLRPDGRRRAIPAHLTAGLGFAQLAAAERAARQELGVTGLVAQAPSGRTRLDADERRLMADRPPHWG
ncbi:hypothetical protein GCM10028815_26900 [Mariniluteicoccus flavus]